MDGFRVETSELAQASARYDSVGKNLEDGLARLRRIQAELKGQTVGQDVLEPLLAAIKTLESAAREARDLGGQCREIADVYERVERQVAALVAALPAATQDSPSTPVRQPSPVRIVSQETAGTIRVESNYSPAPPIFMSGNRLPCESWLLARAVRAMMEGETSWK